MKITSTILQKPEYNFLKENEHLGKQIILLGLGGSYAYGTNTPESDLDIRGIALNRKSDLLGLTSFEQYVDTKTDTCIYSFNKIIGLLLNCNPNVIELLGLKDEHYLYLNETGRALLEHKKIFLSKRVIHSFGGYATAQLRRLQNALARDSYPQIEKEQHIYHSVQNALYTLKEQYESFEEGSLKLYIEDSPREEFEKEIFMDVCLKHYPLRDYKNLWSQMHNVVKDYDKLGKRNKKKDDAHLNKHAMHLIRLFMVAIDLLEKEEIITHREAEHSLLMDIRNGRFQKADGTYSQDFFELVADYERRFNEAKQKTHLPDAPDMKKVEAFMMDVNEQVVGGK